MDDNTVTYRSSAIRVEPDDIAITKVMAVRSHLRCGGVSLNVESFGDAIEPDM
jgi:hypothetical protein